MSEVRVGDDFQDLLLLCPDALVDIFLSSELNKRDPDTVLVADWSTSMSRLDPALLCHKEPARASKAPY